MKFYQRLGLVVYLTLIIIIMAMAEDIRNIDAYWRVAIIIATLISFNMFALPTKDD